MPSDDDSDESDLLGPARPLLATALRLGSRAEEAGDYAGCRALYACTARLARKVRGLGEVADFRLERALEEAEAETDPAGQTDSLRGELEALLGDDDSEAKPEPPPTDPLAATQTYIAMAISIGAPAYNTGDRQGCFDVYACTARMILATVQPPGEAAAKLTEALRRCDELGEVDEQAWAMRHAFDAVGEMGPGAEGVAPREVRVMLSVAVSIGAPAFNLGDHRGCFEVYACTARLLANSSAVPDGVKQALRRALEQASVVPSVTRQAWILRETFDALLAGGADEPAKPRG
ncbi:hypothetical protein [Fimbriiglobus ruber]|uniref:Uncharacterized protein n=1 Tax=Fimbriiglobus ruber TaxID=1908690 RepID=A0A225EDT2_9BACT|nr:hypothetical protein [Fimbriiglobus ruber]OWK46565.1 hypothetical protein FRUB_00264 [Fimbriiglobus ruber]